MFNHELFAVSLGRALSLLRASPPDPVQQKDAVRAVHALVTLAPVSVRVYDGALSIDDIAIANDLPSTPELVRRMQEHGLAEVTIARGAPPADLLVLLSTLAGDPERMFDAGTIKRHLGRAAAASIVVLPVKAVAEASGRRAASITQAFDLLKREDGAEAGPDARAVPGELPPAEARSAAQRPGVPAVDQRPLKTIAPDSPLGVALEAVRLDPYGEKILDRLAVLGRAIGQAFASQQVEIGAQALAEVVRLEPGAPDGTPRSSYAITLLRTLTREVLTQLARHAADPRLAPIVTPLLHRGGADAFEILLNQLATAESIRERKAYMSVLKEMRSGTESALDMLYHDEWFVVRNVAELVGTLRMEEAVPRLAELLRHQDARVCRAAAVALARIASVATVEPLRQALREGAPELRAVVASNIGGPHARALAMPIVALAGDESDPLVLGEYYRALGRIGTPDAVQALATAAQSAGTLFRRRPAAVRVAAIEALQHAGGSLARRTIEALRKDGDKVVRAAAEKAFATAPK
jgi:HEAT repeat protein